MSLPSAEEFRALMSAARDCGVTRVKFSDGAGTDLEVELAPASPGERVVQQINASAGADPLDLIRRSAAEGQLMPPVRDLLDLIANGVRVIPTGDGDPTRPE